jgi:hypothetical protein
VFISYRNEDHPEAAGAMYSHLVERLGPDLVFRDFDSIRKGEHYPSALRDALQGADVLVAVIGPNWLEMLDGSRDRDWVRMEIATAFDRDITVIPVLLNGTNPLTEHTLPTDIHRLATIQALRFSHLSFDADLRQLITTILDAAPRLGISRLFHAAPAASTLDCAPTVLLRVEHTIVDFTGRSAELDQLRSWATDPPTRSVKLVVGPAGSGKTRLAMALSDELTRLGWAAGFVDEQAPAADMAQAGHIDTPLLMIVDDARSRVDQTAALTLAVGTRPAGPPIRTLLLARTDDGWLDMLRNHSEARVAELFSTLTPSAKITLDPATAEPDGQFLHARKAFAAILGRAEPSGPPSRWLGRPSGDECVQTIHAAALDSVLHPGAVQGEHRPVRRLMGADQRHFRRLARDHGQTGLTTSGMATLATVATLCRPATAAQANELRALLPRFLGPDTGAYLEVYTTIYPGPHVINPVRPEPVGDQLVAATLAREPGILTTLGAAGTDVQLVNALAMLGRSIPARPKLAASVIDLIRQQPDRLGVLAIDAAVRIDTPDELLRQLSIAVASADMEMDGFAALVDRIRSRLPQHERGLFADELGRAVAARFRAQTLWTTMLSQMFRDLVDGHLSVAELSARGYGPAARTLVRMLWSQAARAGTSFIDFVSALERLFKKGLGSGG